MLKTFTLKAKKALTEWLSFIEIDLYAKLRHGLVVQQISENIIRNHWRIRRASTPM